MAKKPTYEELEQRVRDLEREALERKRAEEGLRECEKNFRDFADSLPETVYETDAEGNVTFFNRTGRQVFGYTLEDFAEGLDRLISQFLNFHSHQKRQLWFPVFHVLKP